MKLWPCHGISTKNHGPNVAKPWTSAEALTLCWARNLADVQKKSEDIGRNRKKSEDQNIAEIRTSASDVRSLRTTYVYVSWKFIRVDVSTLFCRRFRKILRYASAGYWLKSIQVLASMAIRSLLADVVSYNVAWKISHMIIIYYNARHIFGTLFQVNPGKSPQ